MNRLAIFSAWRTALLALALVAAPGCALEIEKTEPDVIYVPTPQEVVDDMLRLANVRTGDVVYDLGSGDGRIPITAAKRYGVRAVGIDIDPERIEEANANARAAGVTQLVRFRREDLFRSDFREATVVTLYLFPDLNAQLRPRLLAQLRPGTRILSHQYPIGDWKPEKTLTMHNHVVYFWTVPAPDGPRRRQEPAPFD